MFVFACMSNFMFITSYEFCFMSSDIVSLSFLVCFGISLIFFAPGFCRCTVSLKFFYRVLRESLLPGLMPLCSVLFYFYFGDGVVQLRWPT